MRVIWLHSVFSKKGGLFPKISWNFLLANKCIVPSSTHIRLTLLYKPKIRLASSFSATDAYAFSFNNCLVRAEDLTYVQRYVNNCKMHQNNGFKSNEKFQRISITVSWALACALCLSDDKKDKGEKLLRAAKIGNQEEILRLIKGGVDVNFRHKFGWTALHVAAMNGHHDTVKALLDAGCDPNIGDEFSNVYQTAKEKKIHSLEVLVVREDEFSDRLSNRATFQGCTALHYAVLTDSKATVQVLLDNGADPTIQNDAGHKPEDYARDADITKLLKKYTDKVSELGNIIEFC